MNILKSKAVLYAGLIFLAAALITSILEAQEFETYKDKNGYFSFTPPPGWKEKAFPNDPRSKVHFESPDGRGTIGIIVRSADNETFDELLTRQKQNVEDQKRMFPNGHFTMSETTICGFRAVEIQIDIPQGVRQELYFFLTKGLHFNLTYGAKDEADFRTYRDEAMKSLSSINVL